MGCQRTIGVAYFDGPVAVNLDALVLTASVGVFFCRGIFPRYSLFPRRLSFEPGVERFGGVCCDLAAAFEVGLSFTFGPCMAQAVCPKTNTKANAVRANALRMLLQFFLLMAAPFSSSDIQLARPRFGPSEKACNSAHSRQ